MKSRRTPKEPIVVPREYAGRWIVWDRRRARIVASGKDLQEAKVAADAAGEEEPGFEWVPPADRRFVI